MRCTGRRRSDHCPAMKGIETKREEIEGRKQRAGKPPLPRRAEDCRGRNRAAPSWYVALPGRIALPKPPLTCKAGEYPFHRRSGPGRMFWQTPVCYLPFQLSGRSNSPFSPCRRRRWGMLTRVDVLASPCAPSPVSVIRMPNSPFSPRGRKGQEEMRGNSAQE